MKSRKLVISLAAATSGVLLGAGVAFAVWSASGSGTGTAAATVAQGVTLIGVTPTGANATLYPGGPASAVYFQVSNPNPYAITITGVSWGTPVSNSTAQCANTNISLVGSPPSAVSISVPANATSATLNVPGVLVLAHSAPDGCQGVSFNVPMTVTGTEQ
ncbi:MAG TPA: hypothetical protein VF137_11120 [Candidatus Dormibacteraeota bacterium]